MSVHLGVGPPESSVHFLAADDLFFDCLNGNEGYLRLCLTGVDSKEALLKSVGDTLEFPDYFGLNWDALDECLHDLSWLDNGKVILVMLDSKFAWSHIPLEMGILTQSWLNAASYWTKENIPFHIIFAV